MELAPQQLIDGLEGRPWEIARTVKREIEKAAPYAELGIALGVPTWYHFDRVISLIPFPNSCNLHFWRGDDLDTMLPGRLQSTRSHPIRFIELHSMLDMDEGVKFLICEAFKLQLRVIAAEDRAASKEALP
ncbi:MAG: hypothetical protein V2I43_22985 [Parvularcula sp.]|jgi:hypothetical protein|nr:hypothetical protein [Parvularcula sp.]